jgi:hypothetical protein
MRRRFKRSSRCETGKVRYPDELEATKALKRAAAGRYHRGELNHVERRRCGGFHLSSQPRKA